MVLSTRHRSTYESFCMIAKHSLGSPKPQRTWGIPGPIYSMCRKCFFNTRETLFQSFQKTSRNSLKYRKLSNERTSPSLTSFPAHLLSLCVCCVLCCAATLRECTHVCARWRNRRGDPPGVTKGVRARRCENELVQRAHRTAKKCRTFSCHFAPKLLRVVLFWSIIAKHRLFGYQYLPITEWRKGNLYSASISQTARKFLSASEWSGLVESSKISWDQFSSDRLLQNSALGNRKAWKYAKSGVLSASVTISFGRRSSVTS